ncbi:MAG: DNA-binding transcriptional LysR family regulator [Arenicella sp.]|jgi:DNA-binding transcriptional LysR family regulator
MNFIHIKMSKLLQKLDLNLLKVFHSLYVEQNMTRTADTLHLTPSAVSHAVKRLREALDDPLFRRSQNKMLPTAACQRIAPLIIDNLTRLQQILQQLSNFEPQSSEHNFRIGMHDALEPAILPKLSQILSRRAPNVGFASVKIDRNNLSRELSSGHIDVALDVSMPVKSPVRQHRLWSSGFSVLMRINHPLRNSLNKLNYMTSQHISVSNRPLGMTIEDTFFLQQGLERQTSIRCQNYFAAGKVLKSSNQLLTVTKLMAEQIVDNELCIVDAPFALPSFGISIYWHEHSEQDPALVWLRSLLVEMKPLLS